MKSALKTLLLSATVLSSVASASSAGALSCHVPEPLGRGTIIRRFHIPQTSDARVAPDFADLTGSGVVELVQPGLRGGLYELATVSARQRAADDTYRTRATLAFPGEHLLAVKVVQGSLVAIDAPTVVLVATKPPFGGIRLRYVRGDDWDVERLCELGGSFGLAQFAEVTAGGDPALYLRGNTDVSIYSVNGSLMGSIDAPGVGGFAVGQLDADAAMEVVVEGTPGRIVDAVSGTVEVNHPPGFGRDVAIGRSGTGGHWLAAKAPLSNDVTL
jgi:hypothetical protein